MANTRKSEAMGELDPLVGRTISGRYRVHSLLGQGGMGKVFQAQQIPLGRAVALKVLSAEYHGEEDPDFQKRFFHEAAILANLRSPHTVTVFDYGRDGDVLFIAMELVSGEAVDRLLALHGPVAPARALGIAQQICRSLREAHSQGIIHRDLKPGNVLIARGDEGEELVKVLDFGLAKRLSAVGDDSTPNLVPGSPKYMPPEAIRQGSVDARSDIYSLGVMLYQMLTGAVPFDRPNPMDILVAHLQEAPPPMRTVNPGAKVPQALERLVMRCLAKQPERRYGSMQELLEALRTLAPQLGAEVLGMPSAPAPAMRASPAPRLRLEQADVTPAASRPPQRWSGVAVLSAVAACAAVLSLAAYLWLDSERPSAEQAAAPAPVEPSPPAAPADLAPESAADKPDMVISESEVSEDEASPPREPPAPVAITVRSVPPNASVFLRGKKLGQTPLTFSHVPGPGRQRLMMRLEKDGYETFYVRREFSGDEMTIEEHLIPSPTSTHQEPEGRTPEMEPEPEQTPFAEEAQEPSPPDETVGPN